MVYIDNFIFHCRHTQETVGWSDIDRYCDELLHFWLHVEFAAVCAAVRAGLETQIPSTALELMRWDELETMVCGNPQIDIDLLQSATEYERGCSSSDPHILWLWELLRTDFSEEDRKAFIRFCWGRSRLPLTRAAFTQGFKIQGFAKQGSANPDHLLPVSHTCFFSIELPR